MSKDKTSKKGKLKHLDLFEMMLSQSQVFRNMVEQFQSAWVPRSPSVVVEAAPSTRRPVELVWAEEFQWLKDAIACERRLKGWRREKKEALIRRDFEALKELSRTARNPHPSTSSG